MQTPGLYYCIMCWCVYRDTLYHVYFITCCVALITGPILKFEGQWRRMTLYPHRQALSLLFTWITTQPHNRAMVDWWLKEYTGIFRAVHRISSVCCIFCNGCTIAHSFTPTYGQFRAGSPPTGISLGSGRKLETWRAKPDLRINPELNPTMHQQCLKALFSSIIRLR